MHTWLGLGLTLLFAAAPTSSNYMLKSYDIGSGGTSSSSSATYKLNGQAGGQAGSMQSSTTYKTNSGLQNSMQTSEPPAPNFTNPSNYYDRLKLVLNSSGNPTDTKYLIAISTDSFATTKYVQSDNTIGSSQAITNYQTYAAWGGASGFNILGLTPSTTYQVKVKALEGSFTGSAFGPTASASTVATSLSMTLATSLTGTPPFPVNFASLTPGGITNGAADAIIGLTSNAVNGGAVYVNSLNGSLLSPLAGTSIPSATADLSAASSGYGAQVTATSQTAGGPFTSQSPFNGINNNVGGLTTSLQPIVATAGPITTGSTTVRLMAKASAITPSASDYADILTFVIAMNF